MIRSGNLTTLFLATDTNDEEVKELEKIMRTYIPNLRLVRQPTFLTGEDWAAVLAQANFTHMFTVQAMLDKVICAMADVFSGTDASSFSLDITRIRAGLRVKPFTHKEKDEEDRQKVAAGVCGKIQSYEKLYGTGSIAWQPQAGKYVLMDCHRNQMSNRMSNRVRCIRNYLRAAGYLNRTLVVPLHADEITYNYDRRAYFDVNHTRHCFGPQTVLSRDELLQEERERRMGGESARDNHPYLHPEPEAGSAADVPDRRDQPCPIAHALTCAAASIPARATGREGDGHCEGKSRREGDEEKGGQRAEGRATGGWEGDARKGGRRARDEGTSA
ncbi:unnamed protein product [Closterium sp. Naga37s-1]|nr:unnamed protein product [Closterium sp. Naga37s-1]